MKSGEGMDDFISRNRRQAVAYLEVRGEKKLLQRVKIFREMRREMVEKIR